jgi:RNA:NAD 2'-phosphotransferase (TPT1/KptA family)
MAASKSDLVAASKLLSLVLRHDPAALGLTLDPEGWVTVADLVANSSGKLTDPLIRQIKAIRLRSIWACKPPSRLTSCSMAPPMAQSRRS